VRGTALLLSLYLLTVLAAFGGIYAWATAPTLAGAALLMTLSWRSRTPATDTRALDWSIALFVAAVGSQLLPLPAAVRAAVSPRANDVLAAVMLDAGIRSAGARPISVDPDGTLGALALVISAALTYFAARTIFSTGGVRLFCRVISVAGALAAIAALLQRTLSPELIYGVWRPQEAGGTPFGPVVNRNHFAAWLVMATALTAGYATARVARRRKAQSATVLRQSLLAAASSPVIWTAACGATMAVTIVISLSRSAIVGLVVAAVTFARSTTRTLKPAIAALGAILAVAVGLLTIGQSTTSLLANRFAATLEPTDIDRTVIWRETLPIVFDFPLTGVGAGAFERAMLTYQDTRLFVPHLGGEWFFNHAHNHYLQLAAEGGLLLTVPFVVVVVLFLVVVARRLRADVGEMRAVRVGALAGLAGVAVQSVWEVPLTMPAAALLAAALAGIATHQVRREGSEWCVARGERELR
jgi:O-antigen ligase